MRVLSKILVLTVVVCGMTREVDAVSAGVDVNRLEWFKDQKLALMLHFGLYSQIGIIESWPLSDADSYWARRELEPDIATNGFKEAYYALNKSFNPVRFRPEDWAEEAKRNGFRYVIFTTKHHDGFCLYDSKYTDYKVTDPTCPYSTNPRADMVRHFFNECRKRGLGIGAYFSKPDWHHDDFWENAGIGRFTSRGITYNVAAQPERWTRFKTFFRDQVIELVRDYGPLDILWLDGVWLKGRYSLDVPSVVAEARAITPGLIAVDRNGDECEDVKTPEQFVPGEISKDPWESCVTMANNWGYHYDDVYKPPRKLVHMLIDVVAKGGNLALNVGPAPDGRLPRPAVERMREIGSWLNLHGKAIYETRPTPPYRLGNWAYTKDKDGVRYAICLRQEGESSPTLFMNADPSLENIVALRHLVSGVTCPLKKLDNPALRPKERGYEIVFPREVTPNRYAEVFLVVERSISK